MPEKYHAWAKTESCQEVENNVAECCYQAKYCASHCHCAHPRLHAFVSSCLRYNGLQFNIMVYLPLSGEIPYAQES